MAQILIISEEWPQAATRAGLLAKAIRNSGYGAAVISSGNGPAGDAAEAGLIHIPFEPPIAEGRLWGLRNALFFDTAANPGNYAMLRDTLHQHLQEVLYDAVLILCPPAIYLRLGYWIGLSFGIPVWLHLSASTEPRHGSAFHRWNHARLRRKYLGSARIITAESPADMDNIPVQHYQSAILATVTRDGIDFAEAGNDRRVEMIDILQMIIRRKPH